MKWILLIYGAMSMLTFVAYGIDKSRSVRGKRRIAEATLHLLALAGGWPGALAGQRFFRHKTRKLGYQLLTWTAVLLHLAAWVWYWLGRSAG